MKKLNRQTVMILVAGVCLVVAGYSLFSGGEPSQTAAPPSDTPAEATSDSATNLSATNASATPEVYQSVRAQLLRLQAEQTEPFVSESAFPTQSSPPTNEPRTPHEINLPKTIGLPPVFVERPETPPPLQPSKDSPSSSPTNAAQPNEEVSSAPRLRGHIRDHSDGQFTAILDWNGRLIRATNEPNAEWRIIKVMPNAILVQHGNQTYTLEVPDAK